MTQRYFDNWVSIDDVLDDFDISADELQDDEILFAAYGFGSYDGDAIVVFRRDGRLFEAGGSHCSCYGLEGQWAPEETTRAALMMRGGISGYSFSDQAHKAWLAAVNEGGVFSS